MPIITNIPRIEVPVMCMENEDDMYEQEYTDNFIKMIKSCKCFIDVGANFGYYSLLASQYMSKDSKIYAFEPVPIKFKSLKENSKSASEKFGIEIECFNKAVSNEDKENITLYLPDNDKDCSGGLIKNRNHNEKTILVDTITLDNVFKDMDIDLIKIDVEGAELQVLEGASNIIKTKRPILMIEVHKFENKAGKPMLDVYKFFKHLYDNNYDTIQYTNQWYLFVPKEETK